MKVQGFILGALVVLGTSMPVARAGTLFINPTFGTGTTPSIDAAITTAVDTIEGLYATATSASLTIPITFTFTAGTGGDLESTSQEDYIIPYSTYKSLLQADSTANPGNNVLKTALSNLSFGNDANGTDEVALSNSLLAMLAGNQADELGATININSNQTFCLTQTAPCTNFDLIGGLEHEMDEVLGGGGAGSTLNSLAAGACTPGSMLAAFCNTYGPLDLYRYSGFHTTSFSDVSSSTSTAYLSVDGGATSIVGLNQDTGGDMADFYPECGTASGGGQLIQNAFNCSGLDEAYTTSTPEFTMEQALGWDATAADGAVPEPSTLGLLGLSLATLAFRRNRRA